MRWFCDLMLVGIPAWFGFGIWCIVTGRVRVEITDMTGDENVLFKVAVFAGAGAWVTWYVVQYYLNGGHWPGDDY
jgi:hypothetical protein